MIFLDFFEGSNYIFLGLIWFYVMVYLLLIKKEAILRVLLFSFV